MSNQTHWVMDYETLKNLFGGVFEHYKTNERRIFVIGVVRNDLPSLLKFFKRNIQNNEWHIHYNGLAFDSQITEYIIRNHKKLLKLSGPQVANLIFQKAQDCINRSNMNEFQEWSEKYLSIKVIDIFKLNHWDSFAKRSSLKWIQFTTDWPNIQDMPIHYTTLIDSEEDTRTVMQYCVNDVASTKFIAMEKCSKLIALRGMLSKEYGVRLYSASEPRISKEIFLFFMSKKMGIEKKKLKRMRTHRGNILIKNILLNYLRFETREFQRMLIRFQHLVVHGRKTKKAFEHTVHYRGVKTKLGMGGVHGARKGIFKAGNGMIIMSSDVVSYYPNLVIRNNWAPAHLPKEEFCQQYEWFFNERRKIPKKNPLNYVYKIVLNSTFGLTLEANSFLYDPLLGMKITINGQLSLMMLYEMIAEGVPGAIPLMQNTDGVEIMIPEQYRDDYIAICDKWEMMTKLELEHDEYKKLIIPDVNNYIGIFKMKEVTKDEYIEAKEENPHNIYKEEDGKYYTSKTKTKGRFDFMDLALHKAKSFLIVRKALFHYFVHGTEPEEYLATNRNIFDYCAGAKAEGDWKFVNTYMKDGELYEESLQKTLRYYVSNEGTKIIKYNTTDARKINVETNGSQTIFTKFVEKPWEEYDIDERFYLAKTRKEITGLIPDAFTGQKEVKFPT